MKRSDQIPATWDRSQVAVSRQRNNRFLLRPGKLLVAPNDVGDAEKVLGQVGWQIADLRQPEAATVFSKLDNTLVEDPALEVQQIIARLRRATADRDVGPVRAAPLHVFMGEQAAIDFLGQPRIQGGPGSSVRPADLPDALPQLGEPADGEGVKIAVMDTGILPHPWLQNRIERAPASDDELDADKDGYADPESGHGGFIAGLIRQMAPAATVYVVKVLDSNGLGDDAELAVAMEQLPQDVQIVNLSLGGYTDRNLGPLAITNALWTLRRRDCVVAAAAGNFGSARPFWPAAFKSVIGVGAMERPRGSWKRAGFSNFGAWVDVTACGVDLHSTFWFGSTKTHDSASGGAPGVPNAADGSIDLHGWAAWDGTSFSAPIVAAVIARLMSRNQMTAAQAEAFLRTSAPMAPQPDFPLAVRVDEGAGQAAC
jgi:subtilisin family serine protease